MDAPLRADGLAAPCLVLTNLDARGVDLQHRACGLLAVSAPEHNFVADFDAHLSLRGVRLTYTAHPEDRTKNSIRDATMPRTVVAAEILSYKIGTSISVRSE